MKYMLDIVLVVGLLWIGVLWNGEQQKGLDLGEEIDRLKANVAQLQLNLDQATNGLAAATADLQATRALLDQSAKDLLDQTDALAAKSLEAEELRAAATALKARVDELQGYKDRAQKAIVAEMPRPPVAP